MTSTPQTPTTTSIDTGSTIQVNQPKTYRPRQTYNLFPSPISRSSSRCSRRSSTSSKCSIHTTASSTHNALIFPKPGVSKNQSPSTHHPTRSKDFSFFPSIACSIVPTGTPDGKSSNHAKDQPSIYITESSPSPIPSFHSVMSTRSSARSASIRSSSGNSHDETPIPMSQNSPQESIEFFASEADARRRSDALERVALHTELGSGSRGELHPLACRGVHEHDEEQDHSYDCGANMHVHPGAHQEASMSIKRHIKRNSSASARSNLRNWSFRQSSLHGTRCEVASKSDSRTNPLVGSSSQSDDQLETRRISAAATKYLESEKYNNWLPRLSLSSGFLWGHHKKHSVAVSDQGPERRRSFGLWSLMSAYRNTSIDNELGNPGGARRPVSEGAIGRRPSAALGFGGSGECSSSRSNDTGSCSILQVMDERQANFALSSRKSPPVDESLLMPQASASISAPSFVSSVFEMSDSEGEDPWNNRMRRISERLSKVKPIRLGKWVGRKIYSASQ